MKLFALLSLRPLVALAACLVVGAVSAQAQVSLPRAQVGQAYSFQITTSPPAAAGTVYAATGLPTGLSINASSGAIAGSPTTAGTASGSISLTSGGVTNSFAYTLIVDPPAGTPVVTSATTATATVGAAFTYTVTASNAPTSFNVGALPAGLVFSSPTISGTPTTAGTFQIPLSANNGTGTGASVTLVLTVNPAGPVPAITSATSANATAITPVTTPPSFSVNYQITASNTPVSFSATGLPLGISLNSATGLISGTTTIAGIYSVTLSATNNNGVGPATTLTLTVGALSTIGSPSTLNLALGQAMAPFSITASNSPLSYNVAGLPAGLSVNATTGVVSGTPTALGVSSVSISANNATGTGPASTLTLTVGSTPVISSAATATGTAGVAFTFPVTASNTPTSFAAAGLPAGLTINTATGVISGVPAVAGTTAVSLSAANGFGTGAASSLSITIGAAPIAGGGGGGGGGAVQTPPTIVTPPVGQSIAAGGNVIFSVAASGTGTFAYQWFKDGVALPGAMASTLSLAGVAAANEGLYTVTVSNSAGTVTSAAARLTVVAVVAPPLITAQPVAQTGSAGGSVTLSVTATSSVPATYQWRKDGVAIPGATGATLVLSSVTPAAAGSYSVVVTNSAGSVTSSAATVVVNARDIAGAYFGSFGNNGGPFALLVRPDRTAVFVGYAREAKVLLLGRDLVVDASGRFSTNAVATGASVPSLAPGRAAAEAAYAIEGTIAADGSVSGRVPALNLSKSAPAPSSVRTTDAVAGFYQAGAAGSSAVSYAVLGASGDALVATVNGAAIDAGRGTVDTAGRITVTTEGNSRIAGTAQGASATLSLVATPVAGSPITFVGANNDARAEVETLLNISTRGSTGTGGNVLIAGFIINGTQPKPVLVRAIGPTLTSFGVSGALPAARLEVYRGSTSIAVGNDWGAAANAATVAATAGRVGAFALANNSRDAALVLTLEPGAYTAIVSGQGGASGVSLVEAYDATDGAIPAAQRIINISSRTLVGAGDATLIGGFVISGTVPKRVLVRGVGPGLTQFGVAGALARPQLMLYRAGLVLAQNSGWSASADAAAIAAASSQVGAFALPSGSQDAALLLNLEPGAYTAQVLGVGGTTGVALVEIYEVP